MQNEKVLVTGATGFTGQVLVRKLVALGCSVRAIARHTSNVDALSDLPIEWVRGNVYDPDVVTKAMTGDVQYVFHVAAAFREAKRPDSYYRKVHVDSTQLLAEAVIKQPHFKRFVHVSTVGVLGHIKAPPADETAPYNPGDIYQRTKTEAEQWILAFSQSSGLPLTVIRPAAIYGPGDRRLLKLFKMAKRGWVPMIGNRNTLYHLIHVEDLCNAMILAATREKALGEIFICGNREPSSLKQMIEIAARTYNVEPKYVPLPAWPIFVLGDVCEALCKPFGVEPPIYRRRIAFFTKDRSFNTSKLHELLGFSERYSNEEGLRMTAEWYKKKRWL